MISTGELRKGVAIELDGELWQILDYHHIKMGRGSAQVRITLRNIKRGQTVERSFQAGTKWPRASDGEAPGPVPVPRRRRLPLHGHRHLRPVHAQRRAARRRRPVPQGRDDARPDELPGRDDRRRAAGHGRPQGRRDRARLRRRHADRRPQAGARPRPASSCRSRSSSSRATRSASTRGPGSTRPGSSRRSGWPTGGRSRRSATCSTRRSAASGIEESNESQALLPEPRHRARTPGARCRRCVALDRVDRAPRRRLQGHVRRLRLRRRDAAVRDARGRAVARRRGARMADVVAWLEARPRAAGRPRRGARATTPSSTLRGSTNWGEPARRAGSSRR